MKRFLSIIGPGLLVAATGVGAGDLATSALAGSVIGFTAISAIVLGGIIKFTLNEGLANWQLLSNETILETAMNRTNRVVRWLFLIYLMVWSFTVAVALMSATGASFYAIFPLADPKMGKVIYGAGFSLIGFILVLVGGFSFFQKLMTGAVALMLLSVFYAAFSLDHSVGFSPTHLIPDTDDWSWYLAVMGGVGGTVTILCYGYWIREAGRTSKDRIQTRVDLMTSYGITVLLGIAMVVIGSNVQVKGGGAGLLVSLSEVLDSQSGVLVGWFFRIGAFAAIFSSLLGVWQSVPYLFLDVMKGVMPNQVAAKKWYRIYLGCIAFIPLVGLPLGFATMQKTYAITGALFVPMLAGVLLYLSMSDHRFKSGWGYKLLLVGILVLFLVLFTFTFY
ncbi:Nramp family divalent metal transporter [Marinoscillum sp.]|uniref:Nramp family divalent metal transporter n=1 Tax=Marinoscillum sp. TaxID=2024838 RepID=UPI003BABA214